MYESFFGMSRRPFSATPVVECVLETETFFEAKTALIASIDQGNEISVLTGPAGTGKTLLCKVLQADLAEEYEVAFLLNANFSSRRSLLQAILYELGQPYLRMGEQELRLELIQAAKDRCEDKKRILLIVDEAHLLSPRLLEELRSVTNLASLDRQLFQLLLCGNVEFEETLANRDLEAFNQRIGEQTMLERFTREESVRYIEYRLAEVGVSPEEVFTPQAIDFICQASDGFPRCLNQLCDHSLLLGYLVDQQPIELSVVQEALDDLKQLPLHWSEPVIGVRRSDNSTSEVDSNALSEDSMHSSSDVEENDQHTTGAGVIEVGAAWETPPEITPDFVEEQSTVEDDEEPAAVEDTEETDSPNVGVWETGVFETSTPEPDSEDNLQEEDLQENVEDSHALYERIADYATPLESESVQEEPESSPLTTAADSETDTNGEYLWDRYALLDSGRQVPREFPDDQTLHEPSVAETSAEADLEEIGATHPIGTTMTGEEFIPGENQGTSPTPEETGSEREIHSAPHAHHPEQLIDELLPLVQSALEEDREDGLKAEAIEARIQPSEEISEADTEETDESEHEPLEEAPIESERVTPPVTSSDLQSQEDSPTLLEHFLHAQEEEKSDSQIDESTSSDSTTGVRFGRLFTKLRKRDHNA